MSERQKFVEQHGADVRQFRITRSCVNTPSVTISTRTFGPVLGRAAPETNRLAQLRQASEPGRPRARRDPSRPAPGSCCSAHGASSSASGTRVVLPAPGGDEHANAIRRQHGPALSSTASIGSGVENCILSGRHRHPLTEAALCMALQCLLARN
jgi:hypothetical protein